MNYPDTFKSFFAGSGTRLILLQMTFVLIAASQLGCASVGSSLGVGTQPYPYSEELPQTALTDPDFESLALEQMQDEDDVDYQWTLIGQDWRVERDVDPAGNSVITHRTRFVWVGGPAANEPEHGLWTGTDCIYKLLEAKQEHQGGGQYGQTEFYIAENISGPTRYRLRCETKEQLETAKPEHL